MRRLSPPAAAALLAAAALASAPALGAQGADRAAPPVAAGAPASLPTSTLAVWTGSAWRAWWRADRAPARWSAADPALLGAIRWRAVAPGIEWGELRLAGSGEAWRTRAVVARFDPRRVRVRLDAAATPDRRAGAWTVDRAPATALLAFNAGQFTAGSPWGWLVRDGRELLSPGRGPIAPAVVVDADGAVALHASRDLPALRDSALRRGLVRQAFQSYPALLEADGDVPAALRAPGPDLDVAHRDARLALGVDGEGRVLVVLTRFDALGGALDLAPFGLTTPELAALMGALGARQAVALDGGISAQLLIRDPAGERRWSGMRAVPVGLVVEAR